MLRIVNDEFLLISSEFIEKYLQKQVDIMNLVSNDDFSASFEMLFKKRIHKLSVNLKNLKIKMRSLKRYYALLR